MGVAAAASSRYVTGWEPWQIPTCNSLPSPAAPEIILLTCFPSPSAVVLTPSPGMQGPRQPHSCLSLAPHFSPPIRHDGPRLVPAHPGISTSSLTCAQVPSASQMPFPCKPFSSAAPCQKTGNDPSSDCLQANLPVPSFGIFSSFVRALPIQSVSSLSKGPCLHPCLLSAWDSALIMGARGCLLFRPAHTARCCGPLLHEPC